MTPGLFSVIKDERLDLGGSKKNEKKKSVFVGFFKEFIFIFLLSLIFFIKGLEWRVCAFVICC